ncbi:MAG: DUF4358 domain-containing protein [Clostridia bacterium]|nr:DUF4358 domain-containing protein [Clostridia bacterium]
MKIIRLIKAHHDAFIGGIIIFTLLLTALISTAHKPKLISEKENRQLAVFPEVNAKALTDGSFMSEFETYSTDQFAFRDGAVSLKADVAYLTGRPENNGVYFADDGYLISRPDEFDKTNIDTNIASLLKFKEKGEYNMTVAAVPTAYEILRDKLPAFTYTDTIPQIENEVATQFMNANVPVCDTSAVLSEHKDEYIYYRTDHHQTALGSYYIYAALGAYLGYEAEPIESFGVEQLTNKFYGTTWSKASISFVKPDTIDRYTLNGFAMSYTVEYPLEDSKMMGLYAMNDLQKKDKYTVYIGGNHGLTVIRNAVGTSGRSIAILKDSYAHSIAPFLATKFDNIFLIDLRYYNDDIIQYLADNGINDVLVLYDAETFNTDKSLGGLGELAETTSYVKLPPFGLVEEQPEVTSDYFADAVFFGDSITLGHSAYSVFPAKFIAKSATNTRTIYTETMSSGRTMIDELLAQENIGKYYVMFGINEVSYTPLDTYIERYRNMINKIKATNPDAIIYIQSILPVERSQENRKIYKSTIVECNAGLCKLAEELGCYYLDVYSAIADADGYLRDGAAADGVHFAKAEHEKWDTYLLTHAVNLGTIKEAQAFSLYTGGGTADIDGFVSEILSSIEFKDTMSEAADNVTARMFHLDADSVVADKVYAGGGSTAEEFAIFEAANPDEAKILGEKLRERVEEKKPNFETYKPEEMPKLNDPVIKVSGNIAMMCISDDNAKAEEIMSKY